MNDQFNDKTRVYLKTVLKKNLYHHLHCHCDHDQQGISYHTCCLLCNQDVHHYWIVRLWMQLSQTIHPTPGNHIQLFTAIHIPKVAQLYLISVAL